MSIHSETLPAGIDGAVIRGAERAAAGGAVVKLGPPGAPPSAVLKVSASAEGRHALARETAVLTALHADDRLGAWRDLLPQPQAQGSLRGQSYRLDSALAGRVVSKSVAVRSDLLIAAAETIAVQHKKTATTLCGGGEVTERWVNTPLRELVRHAGRRRSLPDRLARLADELHGALAEATLPASWIHGDYWLGNLLFADAPGPSGIVDWETAAPLELPQHDLLHLVLYTRRLHTGRELGQLVSDQLHGREWSAQERALLTRDSAWPPDGSLSERHVLLLYWLRHVAAHARQTRSPAGYRYRWWERRNVLPVLEAL